jgi:hypothetical protein
VFAVDCVVKLVEALLGGWGRLEGVRRLEDIIREVDTELVGSRGRLDALQAEEAAVDERVLGVGDAELVCSRGVWACDDEGAGKGGSEKSGGELHCDLSFGAPGREKRLIDDWKPGAG